MALKKPKEDQVGLKKLPAAVRNKMGYMKNGGKVKAKGMMNGGKVKPKGMMMGGRVKAKGMKNGGKVKAKGYMNGGVVMAGRGVKKPHMS